MQLSGPTVRRIHSERVRSFDFAASVMRAKALSSDSSFRHLYLYDLRAGKTTEVPGSEGLFSPRWSPDGRYVVAMAAHLQGMLLLDTTTSKWRPPTLHQPTDHPSWSPDSAWVYFNDLGDTGLWRVRVR